jgi:hypothetical protein
VVVVVVVVDVVVGTVLQEKTTDIVRKAIR